MYQKVFGQIVRSITSLVTPTVSKRELLVVLAFLRTFSLNFRKRLYKSVSKSSS